MNRKTQALDADHTAEELTYEMRQAVEQAMDSYTLTRAKELLCELWKQGRITFFCRAEGEAALSAALHAIENPALKNISVAQGEKLANAQWQREQEQNNEPF